MKILQINSVCGVGSTGRIATDLADVIKENGSTCKIAYGRGHSIANCDTIKIGNQSDVLLHIALSRITDKHGLYSKSFTKEFIKKVKEYDPDIIHLHNIHGYYINYKLLFDYIKQENKPVVWTLHDCWSFTGHCAHFDLEGCDRWKNGCHDCPLKNEYPASLVLDNSKNNYNIKKDSFTGVENMTIVTPSQWLCDLVKQSFLQDYPVKVINNGIDLMRFAPLPSNIKEKLGIEGKKVILGVATAWSNQKGYKDFIRLSRRLPKNHVIVLVGLDEEKIKELPHNVIGIERTNNVEELAELYTAADVFLNPTYVDTFPTTNLEAMACGTPVITYPTGGSPESIAEGCGFVVKKGSVKEIHNKIREIVQNTKEAYSDTCIKNAQENYDKRNCYLKYYELYSQMKGNSDDL